MSAALGGRKLRRALRLRVEAECDLRAKRHAQAEAVDSPAEWAKQAYVHWPNVKKMERALSAATVETRTKAKAIILELHNQAGD